MSVVLCSWGDAIEGGTEETLSLARRVAQATGQELDWLVIGALGEAAARIAPPHGVAHLDRVADAPSGPDGLVAVIAAYCAEHKPQTILFNQTLPARLIAPRLAARLGVPVVTNGFDVSVADGGGLDVRATAYGGDTHVVYRLAAPVNVISIVSTTLLAEPASAPTSTVTRSIAAGPATPERFAVVSAPKATGPRLEDADIIVSGGRGLGSAANYEMVKEFAGLIGAMHGASRAIVDDGWIDSSRQVGLTGKITRPGLYIAVGISGASQHMAGCSAAKTLVAINKDRDASIYRYARYGIAADCLEVMPELIKIAKANKS